MTRKDYQLIARVIRNSAMPLKWRRLIAAEMSSALRCESSSFDSEKFLTACHKDLAEALVP